MSNHKKTNNWKPIFLKALAKTGLVGQSAQHAGITPSTAYRARSFSNRVGPELVKAKSFAQQWDAALDQAAETLEAEARRRALEGFQRQRRLFRQGREIATEVVSSYSDQLLIFLLKALRPDRFGDHVAATDQRPNPFDEAARLAALDDLAQQNWLASIPTLIALPAVREALAQAIAQEDDTDQFVDIRSNPDSDENI